MLPDVVNSWVQSEAKCRKHLQEYGTFRQALQMCIEERVTSILVQIIHEIDTFNNLDLLNTSEDKEQLQLWLEIFSGSGLIDLDSNTLDQNSLIGLKQFNNKFPFSSIIFGEIEAIVKMYLQQGIFWYLF